MKMMTKTIDQVTVVEISGELDGKTSLVVQSQLSQLPQDGCQIILNMQDVTYLSSAGLRVLLMLNRQVTNLNGQLVIAALSEDLIDTLSETGFLPYLVIRNSPAEALALLQQNVGGQDDSINNRARANRFTPYADLRPV